jgi:hypothetical protein
MSSRSPTRHRVAAALAALAAAVTCAVPAHAAPPSVATVPLPVDGVFPGSKETTVVVDLAALAGADRRAARVEVDGHAVDADLLPVMSDGLSVVLVVDAAAAGAGTLPAWLSAAARFILEAPVGTDAVVVPDRRPAAALTAPQRGPSGVVEVLATVRPEGERDTAAALDLARGQFPPAAPGRRLVVMYTSAPGAGDEEAGQIAEEFRHDGTLLVVVGTAAAGDYWSAAAAATGGFFAPVGEPVVVPALDQVESTLRNRYLVRFPTPEARPARVSITVGTLTAETVLPGTTGRGRPFTRILLIALALATAVAIAILLAAHRRRPRPPPGPPGLTSVFTGRATVPGSTRGQPRVPWL